MTAPPSAGHQRISGEIFRQLANYFEGKCEVFAAPCGVRLFEQDGDSPEEKTVQALLLGTESYCLTRTTDGMVWQRATPLTAALLS